MAHDLEYPVGCSVVQSALGGIATADPNAPLRECSSNPASLHATARGLTVAGHLSRVKVGRCRGPSHDGFTQ